jgi:LytS/YehU family sensor histidine kinase
VVPNGRTDDPLGSAGPAGLDVTSGPGREREARAPGPPWLREPIHLHFLCNTLHLLQGLVHRDPDRVERMLDELCELLIHLLHSTRVPDVPVRDELSALHAYASLQKLRFQGRLDVDFDVDAATLDRRVPGFLLYPLMENAVKFGLETGPTPVTVRVSASGQGGRLRLEVANTGQWISREAAERLGRGHGLALDSVRERLEELFPGQHRFTISEEGGWVRAVIELPAR